MPPADQDHDHLRLLSVLHYIWAGLQALASLIGLAFIGVGMFLSLDPRITQSRSAPPPWFGAIFAGIGTLIVVSFVALAILTMLTGLFLSRRRHHLFCLVISAINCLSMPFGTALGVFTILVLVRPSVKLLFARAADQPPAREDIGSIRLGF